MLPSIKINKYNKVFTLKELKDLDISDAKSISLLLDKSSLNDIDFIVDCINKGIVFNFYSYDYDVCEKINNKLQEHGFSFNYDLLDDGKLIDRSYIDVRKFAMLRVPNTYAMWNVKFDDKLYVTQYGPSFFSYRRSNDTFCGYYDKKTLYEIERIASMISSLSKDLTDIEKVVLVSNYVQKYFQFIKIGESHVNDEVYVLNNYNAYPNTIDEITLGNASTALFEGFGVCRTFADVTTLLSNNPYLKLNIISVSSGDHAWNVINLNGKYYEIDNTRCITRGENRMREALKATKFNSEYILFGRKTSDRVAHEKANSFDNSKIEEDDFDRDYLSTVLDFLEEKYDIGFSYSDDLLSYPTHKK